MKSRTYIEKTERFQYLRVIRSVLSLVLVSSSLIVAGCGGSEDTASKRDPKDRPPSKPAPLSNKHLAFDSMAALLNIGLQGIERATEVGIKDKNAEVLITEKNCQTATVETAAGVKNVSLVTTGSCNHAVGGGIWSGTERISVTLKDGLLAGLSTSPSNSVTITDGARTYKVHQEVTLTPTSNSASPNVFSLESNAEISVEIKEPNGKSRTSNFTIEINGLALISQSTGLLTAIEIQSSTIIVHRADKTGNRDTSAELILTPETSGLVELTCGHYPANMSFKQTVWTSNNNQEFKYNGRVLFTETSVRNAKDANMTTKVAECKPGYLATQFDIREAGLKVLNNLAAKKANEDSREIVGSNPPPVLE